jgi:hypothetical protein
LLVGGVIWLVNQSVGYTILRYPCTINSIGWGIALGVATLLASLAAAFSVFEGALYAVGYFILGALQEFAFGIVLYIFVINAVTFVGLLVLYSLVMFSRFGQFVVAHSPSTTNGVRSVP